MKKSSVVTAVLLFISVNTHAHERKAGVVDDAGRHAVADSEPRRLLQLERPRAANHRPRDIFGLQGRLRVTGLGQAGLVDQGRKAGEPALVVGHLVVGFRAEAFDVLSQLIYRDEPSIFA